jgi:hypothetical protein
MRRSALAAVAASLLAMLLAAGASASHDPSGAPFGEDFAVGSYLNDSGSVRVEFNFSAHSGPAGESPSGSFLLEIEFRDPPAPETIRVEGTVTCLRVDGRRASLGLSLTSPAGRIAALVTVSDEPGLSPGAQGPDSLSVKYLDGLLGPADCPAPVDPFSVPDADIRLTTDETGGITVHDAPPLPTSKDQCKNGGWRNFPGFRNQGECVAFVERHPQP